jgi:hypothetical protein
MDSVIPLQGNKSPARNIACHAHLSAIFPSQQHPLNATSCILYTMSTYVEFMKSPLKVAFFIAILIAAGISWWNGINFFLTQAREGDFQEGSSKPEQAQ